MSNNEIRPKIDIGYTIGKLTVREQTPERKNGYTVWKCQCECGKIIMLDTRTLQRGTVTDCGCNTVVRPGMRDLTGQRYGKLVCLSLSEQKDNSGNTQWICQCDCGNTCLASLNQLRAGYKKSCGCLSHPGLKDYVGKRFNKLTVLAYAGKEKGMHRWLCKCDCGNEAVIGQTNLQNGKTKSCGCLQSIQFGKKDARTQEDPVDHRGLIDGTCISTIKARMERPPISSNKSGYNGVYKNTYGKWAAQITFKKKTYYLGSYTALNEAVKARKKGEKMYENFLEWYYMQYPQKITTMHQS